jgi:rare lipoprotein A (peptidoglycan hydrolase)
MPGTGSCHLSARRRGSWVGRPPRPRWDHPWDHEANDTGTSGRVDRRGRHPLTRRKAGAVALLCTLSTLWIVAAATAGLPSQPAGLSPADFHVVVLPSEAAPTTATAEGRAASPSDLGPIADFGVQPPTFAPRPTPDQRATAKVAAKPGWRVRLTGKHASGSATWYCMGGVSACHADYGGGMYAAAGPELRVGAWRGRIVQVCGGGRCINVKLVDWCACGGNHIIDLYSDAFRRLAPTSTGALRVTVRW